MLSAVESETQPLRGKESKKQVIRNISQGNGNS